MRLTKKLLVVAVVFAVSMTAAALIYKSRVSIQSDTPVTANATPSVVLAQLDQLLGGNIVGDEFLHPDVAYVLSTDARDGRTIVARWAIADGYYLYRDKFKFALKGASGVTLVAIELPPGKVKEDEFFGRVEVFYKQVAATITLQRNATDSTEIVLDVGYQGCAEVGLCYPPITKTVPLALPPTPD